MSATETILARVYTVLSAGLSGVSDVSRARRDARSLEELPAVEVTRGSVDSQPFGAGAERATVQIKLSFLVQEATHYESDLDALHDAAYALLMADSQLHQMCRGFRFEHSDEPEPIAAEVNFSRMACNYTMQTLYRTADLSIAVS